MKTVSSLLYVPTIVGVILLSLVGNLAIVLRAMAILNKDFSDVSPMVPIIYVSGGVVNNFDKMLDLPVYVNPTFIAIANGIFFVGVLLLMALSIYRVWECFHRQNDTLEEGQKISLFSSLIAALITVIPYVSLVGNFFTIYRIPKLGKMLLSASDIPYQGPSSLLTKIYSIGYCLVIAFQVIMGVFVFMLGVIIMQDSSTFSYDTYSISYAVYACVSFFVALGMSVLMLLIIKGNNRLIEAFNQATQD